MNFTTYRDQQRLIFFFMALTQDFEHVRTSLLNRSPLSTLEQAVSKLLSEETRLGTVKPQHLDTVLATHHSRNSPSTPRLDSCTYCHSSDHSLLNCPIRVCKHCRKTGPGHYLSDCPWNQSKSSHNNSRNTWSKCGYNKSGNRSKSTTASHTVIATAERPSNIPSSPDPTVPSVSDIEVIVKQILLNFDTPHSTALSVTSSTSSWFLDSTCCNHMTSDSIAFSSISSSSHIPSIHTANGSHMRVSHVGQVSTSHMSLSNTYYIPALTLNLISVGQLCELGLNVIFSSTGCQVQDPQTGQTLGIGRKTGRLFELINLHLPSRLTSPVQLAASVSTTPSMSLWHSRLGHVSISCLRSFITSG